MKKLIAITIIVLSMLCSASIGFSQVSTVVGANVVRGYASLSIELAGTGTGVVISNVGGINCPGICSAMIPLGTIITLTATPDGGSIFTGFSGGGCSTSPCTFTLTGTTVITATFVSTAHAYNYAFIGHLTNKVTRLLLSDFTTESILNLPAGEDHLYSAGIDLVARRAVFGSVGQKIVVSVNIDTFLRSSRYDLGGLATNKIRGGIAVDQVNGFTYVGSLDSDGNGTFYVHKLRSVDLVEIGAPLSYVVTGGDQFYNSGTYGNGFAISNGFLYIIMNGNACAPFASNVGIAKIDLATFTKTANLCASGGYYEAAGTYAGSNIVDAANNIYMLAEKTTDAANGLLKFTSAAYVGASDSSVGENDPVIGLISTDKQYIYVSGAEAWVPTPQKQWRYNVGTFLRDSGISYLNAERGVYGMAYDGLRNLVYVTTATANVASDGVIKVTTTPYARDSSHLTATLMPLSIVCD